MLLQKKKMQNAKKKKRKAFDVSLSDKDFYEATVTYYKRNSVCIIFRSEHYSSSIYSYYLQR